MSSFGQIEDTAGYTQDDYPVQKRKRKSVTASTVVCLVCGVSVRSADLQSHYDMEVSKLNLLNTRKSADARMKKMFSKSSEKKKSRLGDDETKDSRNDGLWDRSDSTKRIQTFEQIQHRRWNRQAQALLVGKMENAKSHNGEGSSGSSTSCQCPICGVTISGDEQLLTKHVEKCIAKKEGVAISSDSDSDNASDGFDEYTWAGQTRVRATSLLESGLSSLEGKTMRLSTTDENEELNIDDEDCQLYGTPQYSEKDVIPCPADEPHENKAREKIRAAMVGDQRENNCPTGRVSKWSNDEGLTDFNHASNSSHGGTAESDTRVSDPTRLIRTIQSSVSQLETIYAEQSRCLICMEPYEDPLVSVICWHVHCEECWLRTLGAKKLCPQCNVITSPSDLRKIFL